MQVLAFDLSGESALFKKPYSAMSPVSYPLPPPPAVLGLLGAVLGLGKEDYHAALGWERVQVAVGLRAPLRVMRAALNLLQTKDGTDAFFRPRAGANTHTQVNCEFLRDPCFRIHVGGLDADQAARLAESLRDGYSVYTPCLGLAACLAETRWVAAGEARALPAGTYRVASAVPIGDGLKVHYDDDRLYRRVRIPTLMDPERVVHRYREVVVADDGGPIRVQAMEGMLHVRDTETIAFL
ncbi:MAG: type I-B CRISPR-associated protein Cas5 [Marichromatium sp.]|nr:type I-B CRISPR-associated protein Cas5 [Marichromatium sp.]